MDRVPPDQSLASRSVVKSACIASNGVYEAGWSEGAGRVIEPRNSVVVVIEITALGSQRRKADGLSIPEGSSLGGVMARSLGYHRGLRAGHVLTGATRELGRACCLLANIAGREGVPADQEPWRWHGSSRQPVSPERGRHKSEGAGKVLGGERQAKRPERGSGQS
jgi:hypothetical protein